MPRINPAQTIVMSAEIGGGKAIIECVSPRVTYTLELREESPLVPLLVEGAVVTFSMEINSTPTQKADEITSTATLESSGKEPPHLSVVAPEATTEAPAAVPQAGFANTGIDKVKEMMGIGGGSSAGPAPTSGVIRRTT